MKSFVAFLLLLAACEKPNDLARLEDEATVVDKFSQPELQRFHHRIDVILQRRRLIPNNMPGIAEIAKPLDDADKRLNKLDALLKPGSDGKSAFTKQAADAAKAGNIDDLGNRIDEARAKLEEEGAVINDRLTSVEDWESDAESKLKAAPPPPPTEMPAQPPGAEVPAEMPR